MLSFTIAVVMSVRLFICGCSTKLKPGECGLERFNDELAYWQHGDHWEGLHGTTQTSLVERLHRLSDATPYWDEDTDR